MYTMMQVCRKLDMTYQTLKYYCNEGLVPNVKRDKNNRRIFDEHDVNWIKDLSCLKKCDFSIQEPSTIEIRKEMLSKKRKNLEDTIQQLEESIDYIDWKQNFYDDVLSGKKPYVSNLINLDEQNEQD